MIDDLNNEGETRTQKLRDTESKLAKKNLEVFNTVSEVESIQADLKAQENKIIALQAEINEANLENEKLEEENEALRKKCNCTIY